MGLMDHARSELEFAGYYEGDDMNRAMAQDVLTLLAVFSEQGHSEMSANFCLKLFDQLAHYKPIKPLTGEDKEWTEVSENLWQNKRCSRVFKDGTGKAWDIDGKVFREPSGACFTSSDSKTEVTFPYTPNTEYVDVPGAEERGE